MACGWPLFISLNDKRRRGLAVACYVRSLRYLRTFQIDADDGHESNWNDESDNMQMRAIVDGYGLFRILIMMFLCFAFSLIG